MKRIKMVDIRRQDKRVRRRIRKSWKRIVKASDFINGRDVELFQTRMQQYMGVEHVIPCANGTDDLQISLLALNLAPG
ncbi:MAG: DegT/DnrJ/EryC1/StrS family aminotransferase, partial [Bacteroidales bacterium]|nr:DegT/DnrJ/EryC1/StrS family aminotransferase [Bacteroidales bacterium]